MNLPNLPTDNLYKFLALSGVVLILFSLSFPWIMTTELQKEVDAVEGEMVVLEIDTDNLRRELERMERDSLVTLENVDEIEVQTTELAQRSALIKIKTERHQRLLADVKFLFFSSIGGIIAGVFLAISGFSKWYFRVQIYQDMILKKEAGIMETIEDQETEIEVANNPANTTGENV